MAGIPPWLKDKRVQLGIVAAAGLGVIVAVSRGKGALGGGDGDGTGSTITPTTLDSTGTDLYNAIQSVSQGFSDDLRALYDQLRNSGQLDPEPSGGTGGDPWAAYRKTPVNAQPRPWAGDTWPSAPTIPRPVPAPRRIPRLPRIPRK